MLCSTYATPVVRSLPTTQQIGQQVPAAYEFDGLDQWLLQNLWVEDPIDVRRRDLIGWFITANCMASRQFSMR